ncbi:MAG: Uma2 family endonuclease [Okeania sp. SIO3B5]|uniref:Uma2 family endonuclease n=1 Tax=Okeania sp. SIO3B5 TaxID=2607811 RepID=UPI0013FFBACD|nr:Uma2 family endonuclease [Okeania sp. SIO3B5]NEO51738.1 Uma2 family endonuclease [Okeania sp. SIO3B5]
MVLTAQQLEAIMPDATQLESDEPEMESSQHYMQLMLLVSCLEWLWRDRNDYFIGANLTIFYSRQYLKTKDFRGPDFFLVKQTEKRPRKSWVVWEENGKYPNLIIELLSDSTARVDRNLKKNLYQDNFRTPEYFWFDPETMEFMGFRLDKNRYQEIQPNNQGWRWSEELELYLGVDGGQLRYFTANGQRVPTPQEAAIEEQLLVQEAQSQVQEAQSQVQEAQSQVQEAQSQVQEAQSQVQQERERAERLAQRLRELGIDPDE